MPYAINIISPAFAQDYGISIADTMDILAVLHKVIISYCWLHVSKLATLDLSWCMRMSLMKEGHRKSIMGGHAERNSTEFAFQKSKTLASDFCEIQTHEGELCAARALMINYISSIMYFFSCDNFTKIGNHTQIFGNHGERPEITAECERNKAPLGLVQGGRTSDRWFSARLQYLQCISNGDTAVLHKAINLLLTHWIYFSLPRSY